MKSNKTQDQAAKTTTKKIQDEAAKTAKPIADMTNQAMRNYEQAMRTGLKLQEESSRWWTGMFAQSASAPDWPKRMTEFTEAANQWMPVAQKRMEETMEFMQRNSKTSSELMKKAYEAAQTPVLAQSQNKWMDVWTVSMDAMRTNSEELAEMQSKWIDSAIQFVRKNTEITEVRVPKAAAA